MECIKLSNQKDCLSLFLILRESIQNKIAIIKKMDSDEKMILEEIYDDLRLVVRMGGSEFYMMEEELDLMIQLLQSIQTEDAIVLLKQFQQQITR